MAGCCLSNPTHCPKSIVGQTTPRLSGLCSNDFSGESLLAPRHKPHTHSPLPHLQGDDNSTTVQQQIPTVVCRLLPYRLLLLLSHLAHFLVRRVLVHRQFYTIFLEY